MKSMIVKINEMQNDILKQKSRKLESDLNLHSSSQMEIIDETFKQDKMISELRKEVIKRIKLLKLQILNARSSKPNGYKRQRIMMNLQKLQNICLMI